MSLNRPRRLKFVQGILAFTRRLSILCLVKIIALENKYLTACSVLPFLFDFRPLPEWLFADKQILWMLWQHLGMNVQFAFAMKVFKGQVK